MPGKSPLAERIQARLDRQQRESAERQKEVDAEMKGLLERRDQLATVARRLVDEIVTPRMDELLQHFENGKIEILHTDVSSSCVCKFAHTPRFPATVTFGVTMLADDAGAIISRYELSILPVLMEYNRSSEASFDADADQEALTSWVEEIILEFLETYLRLEAHPLYQKDNTVIDIVCGMCFSLSSAASKVELQGKVFYFCSEHCRKRFLAQLAEEGR